MWPSRSDMSRDECRKCLRCLELDAYGNMVSVLRAQGPLTDEKQKLLGELAKVLHISNERHRAEIRRAVNDEKLSVIAEQLNGPNTYTDWSIEGRRTIPLLPRLKAHTAFTGLANSLSLVIAAANEKKLPPPSRVEDPIVKAETALGEESEQDEKTTAKMAVLHSEINARGKKRKRSLPESPDKDKCRKVESTVTMLREPEADLIVTFKEDRVTSPSSIGQNECPNIVQVSIVTPSSTADRTRHNDNNTLDGSTTQLTCTSTNSSNHHKFTIVPSNIENSDDSNSHMVQSIVNTHTIAPNATNRQDLSHAVNTYSVGVKSKKNITAIHNGTSPKVQQSITAQCTEGNILQSDEKESNSKGDKIVNKIVRIEDEGTKISRPDSTTSSTIGPKRITTSKFCVTTKPVITSSTTRMVTVNSESTASGGPGAPTVKSSTLLTYKKMPSGKLDHHSGTKMGISLNSNKTLKIKAHPNARLASKANVIVVQKGSSRGVTLSHGGKEVRGKVIMGGKNLCLTSQKGANSMALLPHRGISNNGEQTLTMLSNVNASHAESLKTGGTTGNMIVLDIRQDVLEKKNVLSQLLEASGALNTDSKTAALQNSNSTTCSPTKNNHTYDSSNSVVPKCQKSVSPVNRLTLECNETSGEENESRLLSSTESADSSDLTDNQDILATIDEEIIEAHGILDAQTGIYNYESNDGTIILDEMVETTVPTTGIDIFSTALTTADINPDNFHYVDNEDDEIVIETGDEVTTITSPMSSAEQLNELSDS